MRRRRSCAYGHPFTEENTRIVRQLRQVKKTGGTKVYVSRRCRRCLRVVHRLANRRARAAGKQLSYPQWLAKQTT